MAETKSESEKVIAAASNYQNHIVAAVDNNRDIMGSLLETFSNLREFISQSEQSAQKLNEQMHEHRQQLQKITVQDSDKHVKADEIIGQILEESDAE